MRFPLPNLEILSNRNVGMHFVTRELCLKVMLGVQELLENKLAMTANRGQEISLSEKAL